MKENLNSKKGSPGTYEKRLYMNEQTLEKTEGFLRLHHDIQSLYAAILGRKELGYD